MRILLGSVVLLCAAMMCGGASAQSEAEAPVAAEQAPRVEEAPAIEGAAEAEDRLPALTAEDVEAWLDGFMPYALARGNVAGAVVTVVKGGDIIAKRGYGYADVAKRTPVDPDRTLFRPGSVSKLLTWTAVMQLVEQGKLDLDADVNTYLDFKVPARGQPITIRHLMTHTSGLEERLKNLMESESEQGPQPLGDYLKGWVPRQIFAPGTVPAYSNYATSLAGYIVERVSGQSFDDYIDQHIFAPTGMTNSSFRQPLPARLRENMAQGYSLASGEAKGYEVVPSAPAGSLAATGTDMARFMIAHLQSAGGEDSPLLNAATAQQMYTPQKRFAPPLNTMALGFYELHPNGQRVIAHGGDTVYFHSYLYLFPEHGVGLFMSVNSAGEGGVTGQIRSELLERFADRYFPWTPDDGKVDEATARQHAAMMAAGRYISSRRAESSFVRMTSLSGQLRVVDNGDGTIKIPSFKGTNGQAADFVEIAPFVWRARHGKERLAAVVEDGRVTALTLDSFAAIMLFQRVEGYRSMTWLKPVLVFSFAVLILSALSWPIAALVRRRYRIRLDWVPATLSAYRWSRAFCWLMPLAWAGWFGLLAWFMADFTRINDGLDKWVILLSVVSLLAIVGGVPVAVWNLLQTLRSGRGVAAKLWALAIVLAMVGLAYATVIFGFVSFSTQF